MPIDPRRLVVLSAIDRHGGVVGAATALHVSPSAVSQQLSLLESETGFLLVDRTRRSGQRRIELTAAGRTLVRRAHELVRLLDSAEAELAALADTVSGPVTISAFFTVLRGFAGDALVQLSQSHPGLQMHVVNVGEDGLAADVLAGKLDLALVEDDAQRRRRAPKGLHYEALADDPYRVVVPADWPEFDDLAAVADRPWIDGPTDSSTGQAMSRVRRTTGLALPAPHMCREFTAALAMVAAGLAGAILPELAFAASAPADVRVVMVPGLGARRIGVLYRRSRHEPTPVVEEVLEALRSNASNQRPDERL